MSISDRMHARQMTMTGFQPRSTDPSNRTESEYNRVMSSTINPIDSCQCPSHTIQRAQRELTYALRGLRDAVRGVLPITNDHVVNAERTLENFGYKEAPAKQP